VESVSSLSPKFLTVHAAGGNKMIKAAVDALPNGSITAVTVLTSFSEPDFAAMGQKNSIEETTKSWAQIAISSGATSLVCSPFEVSALRTLSSTATLITPGVRVEGDAAGDQARIMSPSQAISAGADLVVIGRSITALWDDSDLNMRKKIDQIASTLG
jgi:orotidine-5'-phosphate decarboxylase